MANDHAFAPLTPLKIETLRKFYILEKADTRGKKILTAFHSAPQTKVIFFGFRLPPLFQPFLSSYV